MQLPPPVHGASMVNKLVHDSQHIRETFKCSFVNLTTAKDVNDIGKGSFSKILAMFRIWMHVLKVYRRYKFDLVYITLSPHGLAFYKDGILAILLKMAGAKLVFHLHGKGIKEKYASSMLHRFLYRWIFKKVKIIHLAPRLYEDIKAFVKWENVWFVPNGISFGMDTNSNVSESGRILYLSNMQQSKGSFLLLEAARLLKERKIDFKIDFIGKWHNDDTFKKQWLSFYENHELYDVVTYHGPKYGNEKQEFFKQAGIFVLPTSYKNECFPIAILEAMSYGLPIISTDEGAIADIVKHEETGFIVPKNNVAELANRLEELIKNTDLRINLGYKSKEEFNLKYTSNIFEENLVKTLKEICN